MFSEAQMTGAEVHGSLRAIGLRPTRQREQVLEILAKSDRPLSVEDIREQIVLGQSGVPTIYRNLNLFAKKGLVEVWVGPDLVMRFIRCRSRGHHYHLQCEKCGFVVEIDACEFASAIRNMQERSGFRITRHQLQLFGLCSTCQKEPIPKEKVGDWPDA
jgi:Fur family ferric uptake transcriptional regulator